MTALSPVPEDETWRPIGAFVRPIIKTMIVNAALAGSISTREAERLIALHELRHA